MLNPALVLTALVTTAVSCVFAFAAVPTRTPQAQITPTAPATPTSVPRMSEREQFVAHAAELPETAYDDLVVERARTYFGSMFGEDQMTRGEAQPLLSGDPPTAPRRRAMS